MKNFAEEQLSIFISNSNLIEGEPYEYDEESKNCIKYLMGLRRLSPGKIEKAHGYLMRGKIDPKFTGKFREVPVWIGGEFRDNMVSIYNEMSFWCIEQNSFIGSNIVDIHDLLDLHRWFEKVHPFADGNGRLGRILFLWGLKKCCLDFVYFDAKNKDEYYKMFFNENKFLKRYD